MEVRTIPVGALATNCYLVVDRASNTGFMVDPGDDAGKLLKAVEDENISLSYVILTHAHFDHIMAARQVVESTGAKLLVCAQEVPALSDPELACWRGFGLPEFSPLAVHVAVVSGDKITVGDMQLEFIRTPGHTKGSMCIRVEDAIFSGDTLFADSCGRCDFPGGDYREMLDSLRLLAELEGDCTVYPGHGQATSLDVERRFNPYVREAMSR